MAYFNHAFSKMFLGTGSTLPDPIVTPIVVNTDNGFLTDAGVSTAQLSELPVGYFGFFDAKTYLSLGASYDSRACCPVILASSAIIQVDKIGPFHGGYRETNKSKVINPKYVQKIYRVDACEPKQAIVSVGNTPTVTDSGNYADACEAVQDNFLDVNKFQGGTTCSTCCFEFLCGETYYLRIDVKGSPALRALNHNAYQTVSAYTGCCVGPTPTVVDSTLVMIEWAKAIVINNYLKDFVLPVVFDESGLPWYAPGTVNDPITGTAVRTVIDPSTGNPVPATWNLYASLGHIDGACAGLRLFGAFVETKFLTCTFQVTDFFEKEPIKIYASMVDYTGDPCVFEGICVYNDCLGLQGMGFGEQVLRDLVRAESYLQNFFHSDFRVRDVTRGYDISDAVNRNALYTRYYLLHSVPRFNNPTGVFDNDRYLLEIITNGTIGTLETFFEQFENCTNCEKLADNTYECVECTPVPNILVP